MPPKVKRRSKRQTESERPPEGVAPPAVLEEGGTATFVSRPVSPDGFTTRPVSPNGGGDAAFESRAVSPVGSAGPHPPQGSAPSSYGSSGSIGRRNSPPLTLDPMRGSVSAASWPSPGSDDEEDEWSDSDDETPRPASPALGSPLCDWEELKDDDGDVFYYNRRTEQTQWDPPLELEASISSLRESLRASVRMDYAATMLDLSDDDVFRSRAASPRGPRAMSADAGPVADEFQSRAVSPRSRAGSSPDRSSAHGAQLQLHDALLENALGGVQVAAQL
eukprot:COSAG02_NODE_13895_length_1333_cov_3.035656_1_plen_276_part_10